MSLLLEGFEPGIALEVGLVEGGLNHCKILGEEFGWTPVRFRLLRRIVRQSLLIIRKTLKL